MARVTLNVRTSSQTEMKDITADVRNQVRKSGVSEGLCVVSVPHTTAAVTINESADPAVRKDILMELNKIVPLRDGYAHMEGNSAAHIKTLLTGSSVSIPVEGGDLVLGTWQAIYFCEYDGGRSRKADIIILSAGS
jgi:secondary thiamine-phosphate synthase enzyme